MAGPAICFRLGLAAAPLLTHVAAGTPLSQRPEVHMEIKRSGSQPSSKGPADWFTGTVRIDPLFQAHAPARDAGTGVLTTFVGKPPLSPGGLSGKLARASRVGPQ